MTYASGVPGPEAPGPADTGSRASESAASGLAPFDPVAYINNRSWHTSRMGLQRITELMGRLGNPQRGLRVVHVAGTNGKGSTCAFVASVLQEAGYRTGLFTSPYVIEFAERIRVDGANIAPDELLQATLAVREHAEAMDEHPTEFELMTAVALLHFSQKACDVAVLEVGLGGRLDSTNVVDAPEVCAITPIALDHTELLGETLGAIAAEKCGIVKPGATVASAFQQPEAAQVVRDAAARAGCPYREVDPGRLSGTPACFSYKGYERLSIGLMGSYQPQNAALAVEVVEALRERGLPVSDDQLRRGLAAAAWPARFQVVSHGPTFIVDGGHNPQGAQALAESLAQAFPGRRPVFLVGVLADKDYPAMLETVLPLGDAFVCTQPPSPRALPAADLAQALCRAGADPDAVQVEPSIPKAVCRARQVATPAGVVCAFGSLYSVADIMKALQGAAPPA